MTTSESNNVSAATTSISSKAFYNLTATKFLTWHFIEPYTKLTPNWGPLGLVVYLRTYSRYIPELRRREAWWETVLRVVEYSMSLHKGSTNAAALIKEAQVLYENIFHLKVFPSGRSLWSAGSQVAQQDATSQFNCAFLVVDKLESFEHVFHLLLVGAGCGFSVEQKYVSKLPKFKTDIKVTHKPYEQRVKSQRLEETKTQCVLSFPSRQCKTTIEVGDSRAGWEKALYEFLYALQKKQNTVEIEIIYDSIRPAGERLKTMGGRSSGYHPLLKMFQQINLIIQEAKEGRLTSVQAMDINNAIAGAVVVGGVRRSSQLSLGDLEDSSFIEAKRNLWTDPDKERYKSTRVMSNNSVAFYKQPAKEKLAELMESTKTHGDPGLINAESARKRRADWQGTNPCFIAGTMVLTSEGHFPIEELVGKEVTIYDGKEWRTVNNFRVTGEDQEVYHVHLHNGQSITATSYHSFILSNGTRKQLKDLVPDDILLTHDEVVNASNNHKEAGAYLKGFLVGDGTATPINKENASTPRRPLLWLYEPKYMCADRLIASAQEIPIGEFYNSTKEELSFQDSTYNRRRMTGIAIRKNELLPWVTNFKYSLPTEIFNWNTKSKLEFIAGVMDSDGCASDTKNGFLYQLTSISKNFLLDFQLLLRTVGVKCKLSLGKEGGITNFGEERGGWYETKTTYRLTISQDASVKLAQQVMFSRLISFADKSTKYAVKSKESKVVSITYAGVAAKVYCCTVEGSHSFALSNGLLVGQCSEILMRNESVCNLTEVNVLAFVLGPDHFDYNGFTKAVQLATRMGSRITNTTLWHPDWDAVQKQDRLLGVSLTGQVEAWDALGWGYIIDTEGKYSYTNDYRIIEVLELHKQTARTEADIYHEEMGIPRSLLVTTVKPSGSISNLPGVSAGIHRPYAPYYLRRVRVSKNDPVAKALRSMGVPCNPENSQGLDLDAEECNTWVFTFPIKTNAPIQAVDERAVDQLERYKQSMVYATEHNVSITISVAPEEWDDVLNWLDIKDNWDLFVGVSFLPKFDSTNSPYPQMPYTTISKSEYEVVVDQTPSINEAEFLSLIAQYEQEQEEYELDADCAEGSCPVR